MNEILNIFNNIIVPGMLNGEIDCEILVHIICNIYFIENQPLLEATNQYEGVRIPTLVIKNKQNFITTLTNYVDIMMEFYENFPFVKIDKEYYKQYLIACAFANMGIDDYLDPENYFQKRIEAIKNNPFELSDKQVPITFSSDFNSDMFYTLNKEKPNEECPFKYTLFLKSGDDEFEFQTIRFFINDDTAYIGAIQGNKPDEKNSFQKKIKRILYKANEGITPENGLYQTNPGAVVALTSFIGLLNSYGINKITILPYGIQRWNDKKILYHNLNEKINSSTYTEPQRIKVKKVIERL